MSAQPITTSSSSSSSTAPAIWKRPHSKLEETTSICQQRIDTPHPSSSRLNADVVDLTTPPGSEELEQEVVIRAFSPTLLTLDKLESSDLSSLALNAVKQAHNDLKRALATGDEERLQRAASTAAQAAEAAKKAAETAREESVLARQLDYKKPEEILSVQFRISDLFSEKAKKAGANADEALLLAKKIEALSENAGPTPATKRRKIEAVNLSDEPRVPFTETPPKLKERERSLSPFPANQLGLVQFFLSPRNSSSSSKKEAVLDSDATQTDEKPISTGVLTGKTSSLGPEELVNSFRGKDLWGYDPNTLAAVTKHLTELNQFKHLFSKGSALRAEFDFRWAQALGGTAVPADLDQAITLIDEQIEESPNSSSNVHLRQLGIFLRFRRNSAGDIAIVKNELDQFKDFCKDPKICGTLFRNIALEFHKRKEYSESIEYLEKAEKEPSPEVDFVPRLLFDLSNAHWQRKWSECDDREVARTLLLKTKGMKIVDDKLKRNIDTVLGRMNTQLSKKGP